MQLGVKIRLGNPDQFLKIKESLTRIGVCSNKTKTIYQSCHILHKAGNYYIVHFKEMFVLDGKSTTISEDDLQRRDCIVKLLVDWKLCIVEDRNILRDTYGVIGAIKVLPYSEKEYYNLVQKYTIGKAISK